jgi:glutathione S-transferase
MIFHLAEVDGWAEAEADGLYRRSTLGRSLAEEGFIHCSHRHQVEEVANAFYRGHRRLLLLVIDPSKVTAEIRDEPAGEGTERFPHIYGPLNRDAVVEVRSVRAGDDGRFTICELDEDPR